jgi:hypothetical protein
VVYSLQSQPSAALLLQALGIHYSLFLKIKQSNDLRLCCAPVTLAIGAITPAIIIVPKLHTIFTASDAALQVVRSIFRVSLSNDVMMVISMFRGI